MLVLLDDRGDVVAARDATLRERLGARLRSFRLDHQLADGISPDASPALALRAQALVRPQARRRMARELQRVLAEALAAPRRPLAPNLRVSPNGVREIPTEFRLLIERVRADAPVPARGVAQVQVLLTDACGPLYQGTQGGDLRAYVLRAADALQPAGGW